MVISGDVKLAGANALEATLIEKLQRRTAVIGVAGLGYVGLPFVLEKAKVGFRVIGIDRDPGRVGMVNTGTSYIPDVATAELREQVDAGRIVAVTDFSCVPDLDVIVIAVPTPLTKNLTPDLRYVEAVASELAKYLRPGQLVSLESTTYPGTTEEIMRPMLEANGLLAERDFFLTHSPERVDPGNHRYTTKNTNKVVGGVGPRSLAVGTAFYAQTIDHVVPVSSAKAAELVKVFENTFRAVNIALVNELAMLCDKMALDVWEVLDAANTKPFGIMPFYPGPGVGGHCIPIDPHYLEWKAKELNFNTHFIALAGEINRNMPAFVVDKALRVLNAIGKAPSMSRILVLGAGYKRDLDDYRESPSLVVMRLLEEAGAEVAYHDPHVPRFNDHGYAKEGQPLTLEVVRGADLVVIATDHSAVDYEWVVAHAGAVLDTRNATRAVQANRERITRL